MKGRLETTALNKEFIPKRRGDATPCRAIGGTAPPIKGWGQEAERARGGCGQSFLVVGGGEASLNKFRVGSVEYCQWVLARRWSQLACSRPWGGLGQGKFGLLCER